MARRIRPVGHEDRLSLVDHLDELRTRIILSLVAFGVALALCFWQNHLILRIVNDPLNGRKPITPGVAEPFTTTFTLAAYAAILISLPVVLYQLYAFILPASTPAERRLATPLLPTVQSLFVGAAVVAMLLPGVDPVSMLIEMVPMIVLYELSILLAVAFGRPSEEVSDRIASAEG